MALMQTPPWLQPPNFLGALSGGAEAGAAIARTQLGYAQLAQAAAEAATRATIQRVQQQIEQEKTSHDQRWREMETERLAQSAAGTLELNRQRSEWERIQQQEELGLKAEQAARQYQAWQGYQELAKTDPTAAIQRYGPLFTGGTAAVASTVRPRTEPETWNQTTRDGHLVYEGSRGGAPRIDPLEAVKAREEVARKNDIAKQLEWLADERKIVAPKVQATGGLPPDDPALKPAFLKDVQRLKEIDAEAAALRAQFRSGGAVTVPPGIGSTTTTNAPTVGEPMTIGRFKVRRLSGPSASTAPAKATRVEDLFRQGPANPSWDDYAAGRF